MALNMIFHLIKEKPQIELPNTPKAFIVLRTWLDRVVMCSFRSNLDLKRVLHNDASHLQICPDGWSVPSRPAPRCAPRAVGLSELFATQDYTRHKVEVRRTLTMWRSSERAFLWPAAPVALRAPSSLATRYFSLTINKPLVCGLPCYHSGRAKQDAPRTGAHCGREQRSRHTRHWPHCGRYCIPGHVRRKCTYLIPFYSLMLMSWLFILVTSTGKRRCTPVCRYAYTHSAHSLPFQRTPLPRQLPRPRRKASSRPLFPRLQQSVSWRSPSKRKRTCGAWQINGWRRSRDLSTNSSERTHANG
jgi:hypothetical protein